MRCIKLFWYNGLKLAGISKKYDFAIFWRCPYILKVASKKTEICRGVLSEGRYGCQS